MFSFDPVDPKQNFPELEHQILEFWQKNDTFRKSIEQKKAGNSYVFFDGPPFATGLPHYGHILAGTIKDVIPRFFAMRGKKIGRRFGWDCHGVPVEFQVEKENNIGGKPEIEKMGIGAYNELCHSIVLRCAGDWEKTVTRMGRWVDFENDYKTMEPDYMESVWWVFKSLWDKGLIYEGEKVVPYSPKLGSPLSNFEAGLNYKNIDDPAVTVKFELEDEPGTYVLAWTTTPWTLPSNLGLVMNPSIEYVRVRYKKQDGNEIFYILKKKDWMSFFSTKTNKYKIVEEDGGKNERIGTTYHTSGAGGIDMPNDAILFESGFVHVVDQFKGKIFLEKEKKYKPLFPFFKDHENAFRIFADDFVSDEEGTGIVHMAPTGEDDARILTREGVKLFYPFTENCYFDFSTVRQFISKNLNDQEKEKLNDLDGLYFRYDAEVSPETKEKNANKWVIKTLEKENRIVGKVDWNYKHSYPHCWRTECALMYRGVKTWFVEVEKIKERMVELNKQIHWVPDAVGHKRFANWLENAKDWAISRNRYWGAPLPIWRCTCGNIECLGSIEELQNKSLKTQKIVVMRHGEGTHNIDGTINSDPSRPVVLTAKGRSEVAESGKKLCTESIEIIIASPFPRTRETAEIVATELGIDPKQIQYDDRLKEINVGTYEGKLLSDFRKVFATPHERYYKNPHNGETEEDVFNRTSELLKEVRKKYSDKNILLVTHGDPARNIRRFFTNETPDTLFGLHGAEIKLLAPAQYETYGFGGRPEGPTGDIDLHRPYIDAIKLECPKCQKPMLRIPEVLDCWFESGSMPYGQAHYPFENKDWFEQNFPADFIAEGLDQTRGWFYTLHVLATALFDTPAFRNVIVNGIVLAEDGQKMSKSKKNYPDPHEVFEKFGVDAVRFTLMNSPVVKADDLRFSEKAVLENMKNVFLPLWNAYSFFVTYANIDNWEFKKNSKFKIQNSKLDKWILSELGSVVKTVTKKMEGYEIFEAVRNLYVFLEKLTNSYIRRCRRRFWKSGLGEDKAEAFETLHTVLTTFCQLLAPFAPFMSEHIYKNLTKEESVHLSDFPNFEDFPVDEALRTEFNAVETIISLGLSLRAEKQVKVRQPLGEVEIFLPEKYHRSILELNEEVILQELNVKKLVVMNSAEKICQKIAKPNARVLGPKFGKQMQEIIATAKSGKFTEVEDGIMVGEHLLETGSYDIEYLGQPGFDVASSDGIVVALSMELTEELKNEGLMRELIRLIQDARKEAGFEVADRITLGVNGDENFLAILRQFEKEIMAEVLAEKVVWNGSGKGGFEKEVQVDDKNVQIILTKF